VARDEVLIAGAGPVGMALALALSQAGVAARLLDARARGAAQRDPRVLALSYGSRQILERLGVWPQIRSTPIETIHISQQGAFGRTVIRAADYRLPALGYVADAGGIAAALDAALAARGIEPLCATRVENVAAGAGDAIVSVSGADGAATLCTRLVAHAEGAANSHFRLVERDYGQQAIITVAHSVEPFRATAYERFTSGGPLALLPHQGGYAVVYTVPTDQAQSILGLSDADFLEILQRHFGTRLRFARTGPRTAFPLALRLRPNPIAERCVWLGNAAQTLHPVAGQGFNLALRDVWSLAELLRENAGGDAGSPALLARYAAARRIDRGGTIGFTDNLIRLFGSANPLLSAARGGGLALLDILPPLRAFVAKRMIFGARAWP
jgi:2-octaprenyl-6-methoxyphenol hydroxylase